jgi:hypothetical protein
MIDFKPKYSLKCLIIETLYLNRKFSSALVLVYFTNNIKKVQENNRNMVVNH